MINKRGQNFYMYSDLLELPAVEKLKIAIY